MEEQWKPVPVKSYEHGRLYEVSNLGRVKSLRSGRIMSQKPNIVNGYYHVQLSVDGVVKVYNVHRLVAEAFIEKPEGDVQVDHIDGIKKNNRADNLRWITFLQNMANREFRYRPRACEHCGMPILARRKIDGTEARLQA